MKEKTQSGLWVERGDEVIRRSLKPTPRKEILVAQPGQSRTRNVFPDERLQDAVYDKSRNGFEVLEAKEVHPVIKQSFFDKRKEEKESLMPN